MIMICQNRVSPMIGKLFSEEDEQIELWEVSEPEQSQGEPADISTALSPEGAIELFNLKVRIALLEEKVVYLQSRLATESYVHLPATSDSDPCLAVVLEVTQEMFGTPEVEICHDPEDHEHPFVVFTVYPSGTLEELTEKRVQWHQRISIIPPGDSGSFRLSIVPKE